MVCWWIPKRNLQQQRLYFSVLIPHPKYHKHFIYPALTPQTFNIHLLITASIPFALCVRTCVRKVYIMTACVRACLCMGWEEHVGGKQEVRWHILPFYMHNRDVCSHRGQRHVHLLQAPDVAKRPLPGDNAFWEIGGWRFGGIDACVVLLTTWWHCQLRHPGTRQSRCGMRATYGCK